MVVDFRRAATAEGPAMSRDCQHGSLARSCEVCDLEAEVQMLRGRIAAHRRAKTPKTPEARRLPPNNADRYLWDLIGDNDE